MKKRLSDAMISRLKVPKDRRLEICDSLLPGLSLRITTSGIRTFSVLFKVTGEGGESKTGRPLTGQAYRMTLDRYPRISVAEARARAKPILAAALEGRNPLQAKYAAHRERRSNTVAAVSAQYIKQAESAVKNWGKIQRTLSNHVLPAIGDRPIRDIGRQDIHDLLDKLTNANLNGAAAEVLKHVRSLFEFALDRELVDRNPAAKLNRPELKPTKKARVNIPDADLKAIWGAATEIGYPFGDWVRLLILTGARGGEWAKASWAEVDVDARLHSIPAERYKTSVDHELPLVAGAWQIVSGLPRQSEGDYLFSTTAGRVAIDSFSKLKLKLDKLALAALRRDNPGATLGKYTFHDFRSTHKSRLAGLGVSQEHRDRVHGHAQTGMDSVYNRHAYDAEKRAALTLYAKHIAEVVA